MLSLYGRKNITGVIVAIVLSVLLLSSGDSSLFTVETEHPAFRLDGCTLEEVSGNILSLRVKRPGKSVVVLRAYAPLKITEQNGVKANLRPGWDGTLGYSLYALEIETGTDSYGKIRFEAEPVHSGASQSRDRFDARNSRFPSTSEEFLSWQQEWRNKLTVRLMNGALPDRVPLEAEVLSTEDHPLFTLRRVRYMTRSDKSNTLLISLPKNTAGKVPLLVALHGHEAAWGEADSGAFIPGHIDDFCAYFAERGWAVLQPATMDHTLRHEGWTLQGEWTWDAIVAIDYAATIPEVDTRYIAVCGLSTGGHLAMNLLALDDRISSGVVGCVLSTWNHYQERMRIPPHCDCGILNQLGNWLEQCDWAALAAPKPVQFQHGRQDAGFCPGADPSLLNTSWNTSVMPADEFDAAFKEVERAYRQAGKAKNLVLHIHDNGHRVDNSAAYDFLTKVRLISYYE